MSLLAVVLAGGEGRRIGGGKPERTLGGERLIDRAIAQAKRWSDHVAVAAGREPRQAVAGISQLLDREGAGPVAGLLAAVRHAVELGVDDVLITPCDTPFLPDDLPKRLAAARPADCAAAIPRTDGQLHPGCSLWRAGIEPEILAYVAEGRSSLIGLAERIGYAVVPWSATDFDPFLNINSPEDLARAEDLLRSR